MGSIAILKLLDRFTSRSTPNVGWGFIGAWQLFSKSVHKFGIILAIGLPI
jgi:hypothetical protein